MPGYPPQGQDEYKRDGLTVAKNGKGLTYIQWLAEIDPPPSVELYSATMLLGWIDNVDPVALHFEFRGARGNNARNR